MLFVAEYELTWDRLDAAIAKRLEWDEVKPDDFRFVGEYIWQEGAPPFRGVAIIEAASVDALNSFALHYGPTLTMRMHPASDVVSALRMATNGATPTPRGGTQRRGRRRSR